MTGSLVMLPYRRLVLLLMGVTVAVLISSLLPVNVVTGAVAASPKHASSLDVNGDSVLLVVQKVAAGPASTLTNSFAMNTASVLASPVPNQSVALPGCITLTWICGVGVGVKDLLITADNCATGGMATASNFSFHGCLKALLHDGADLAKYSMWTIAPSIKAEAVAIGKGMQQAVLSWTSWVLNDELGGHNTVNVPIVSCKAAVFEQATTNCHDSWFLGQYNMMRQAALFLLVPLFMLVIMQSVIKGSTYLLVRSAFVMLPIAIVGTVVIVYFTQLLLNLSDDFVDMVGNYTQSTNAYATEFNQSVAGMDMSKVNWFAIIWMFILLVGSGIVYIELLIRQLGVYMSALFLPAGFAALVWPSIAGFLQKLLKLLLALIFSKVFIAIAIELGISAFGNVSAVGLTSMPGQQDTATTAGLTSLIGGSMIFLLALTAWGKVVGPTVAGDATNDGRLVQTNALWGKFQLTSAVLGRLANWQNRRNRNRGTGRLAQLFSFVPHPSATGGLGFRVVGGAGRPAGRYRNQGNPRPANPVPAPPPVNPQQGMPPTPPEPTWRR
jgi:hypothetical protein